MARIRMKSTNVNKLTQGDNQYDIFISYRRDPDEDLALLIFKMLTYRGYKVFLDHDSNKDGNFINNIEQAINSAPVFILLFSDNSWSRINDSNDMVRHEIELAVKLGKKIIPICKEPNKACFPDSIPESIKPVTQYQISRVRSSTLDEDIDSIIDDRISKRINKKPKQTTNSDFHLELGKSNLKSNSISFGIMLAVIILACAVAALIII